MSGPRLNPHLLRLPLYVAGKSPRQAMEAAGISQAVKLASNENPLGPSPLAMEALRAALGDAHRYPGLAERDLAGRLAEFHGGGLGPDHYLVGNGATDLLRMLAQAFIFDGGTALMGEVSFPLFRIVTTMFAGTPVSLPPEANWHLDLKAMSAAADADTRIIWLCSPNNPTGLALNAQDVRGFIADLPDHVVVVLDESYADFVTDPQAVDGLDLVRSGLNVVALRSFSKGAGLANLRIGYAVANPELISYLQRARLPFHSGAPVLAAAMASLDDFDHRRRTRQLVVGERDHLCRSLNESGLLCLESQANFVLLPEVPGGGEAFADRLLRQGFIVRPMGAFGLAGGVRVSVGTPEGDRGLLRAVEQVLAEPMPAKRPESR